MAYEKVFTNPYPNGWEDLPSEETPITASALQEHTDAIEHIEDYLENNPGGGASTWSEVAEKPFESIGNNLSVDENGRLNAIGGGGGSDDNYGTKADFDAVKDSLPIGSAFDILDDGEGGGGSGSLEIYHANWVASSCSNSTTPLTADLIVPKGKYLVLAHTPYASAVNARFPFMIKVNTTDALDCIRYADTTYGQILCVVTVDSDNSNIRLFSATSDTSASWSSSYHSRGGLDAIKIS